MTGVLGIDHVQLAMPHGGEPHARRFWVDLMGLEEVAKPAQLAVNGGCWFESGQVAIHCGVEDAFLPARRAHPALIVGDLAALSDGAAAEKGVSVRGLRDKARRALGGAWET